AQGITYIVSSGDTGSAGCDNLSETTATGPISVNFLASTPFNVAVGGTIFNENNRSASYWSSSTSTPVTALKYIPENVWNESCTAAACGNSANIAAGGGGPSTTVPKPNWQSGSSLHIPADGFRDVPDVSLTAALHDPYLICLLGSCSRQGFLVGISGTSASAPSFAGIMALVLEKLRMTSQNPDERLGLANYVLYRLANAETLSQCNASGTSNSPASTCVFNDVTVGNNAVPGEASYGGPNPQFPAAVGYDLATGLGSVQVNNLVNAWAAVTYNSTTTTLTLTPNPVDIVHGAPVQVHIAVTPGSGSTAPTGDVSLLASQSQNPGFMGVTSFQLTNGSATGVTNSLPGGPSYFVHAHYAGDATFAPSDSNSIQVAVSQEPSTTTVKVLTADSQGHPVPFTTGPYGGFVDVRADVAGQSGFGVPTGTVFFTDGNSSLVNLLLNSQGNTATPQGIFTFVPGPHVLSATYGGDSAFTTSTSAPVSFTINKAASATSVQSSSATVGSGSAVTLTATVNTTSRGAAPTGNVTFFNGNTQLGTGTTAGGIDGITGYSYASTALQTMALPNGQNSITAQYTADTNYTASTSPAITVNVAPDYSLDFGTANPIMTASAPGASGTLTLTVTGQTGYTGTVNFASTPCGGLPVYSTCTFNPPSVTGSGTTTVTITTTAPHIALPGGGTTARSFGLVGSLTLAGVFVLGFAPGKRRWSSVFVLLLLAWLLTGVGCGGSSGSGSGNHAPGTPVGSFPVTVTGDDGTFKHTANFTLTVQ
ncbi:MAG TPA: Ig-like domain repeat protein, partial [Terriglobales bacterium]|nr:Ig-like domain repeat protein [Terriglobales bacterium]